MAFRSSLDGTELRGTFAQGTGACSSPVLLIAGSGKLDRDETMRTRTLLKEAGASTDQLILLGHSEGTIMAVETALRLGVDRILKQRPDAKVYRYSDLGHGFSPDRDGKPTVGPIDARVLADIVAAAYF